MDKTGAVHRLDRRLHWLGETSDANSQATKTIRVRWRRARVDGLTRFVEQAEIETLATQIQSAYNIAWASLRLCRTRGA